MSARARAGRGVKGGGGALFKATDKACVCGGRGGASLLVGCQARRGKLELERGAGRHCGEMSGNMVTRMSFLEPQPAGCESCARARAQAARRARGRGGVRVGRGAARGGKGRAQ